MDVGVTVVMVTVCFGLREGELAAAEAKRDRTGMRRDEAQHALKETQRVARDAVATLDEVNLKYQADADAVELAAAKPSPTDPTPEERKGSGISSPPTCGHVHLDGQGLTKLRTALQYFQDQVTEGIGDDVMAAACGLISPAEQATIVGQGCLVPQGRPNPGDLPSVGQTLQAAPTLGSTNVIDPMSSKRVCTERKTDAQSVKKQNGEKQGCFYAAGSRASGTGCSLTQKGPTIPRLDS